MISIVIPTLNEERYLPHILDDLEKQTFKDYEIIVADAGSKDKTRKIAEKYGCRVVEGGMPAEGRNAGAKAAKGDFLVFFDADVRIQKDFLEKAFDEFQKKYFEIATCDMVTTSNDNNIKLILDFYNDYARSVQYFRPSCGGPFIMTTKRLFERLHGFDETLRLSEDHDFAIRGSKLSKFGILDSVNYVFSTRRLKKEGTLHFLLKTVQIQLYHLFKGKITEDVIEYEFGKYEDVISQKEKSEFRKQFRKLRRTFKRLKKKINENGLFSKLKIK